MKKLGFLIFIGVIFAGCYGTSPVPPSIVRLDNGQYYYRDQNIINQCPYSKFLSDGVTVQCFDTNGNPTIRITPATQQDYAYVNAYRQNLYMQQQIANQQNIAFQMQMQNLAQQSAAIAAGNAASAAQGAALANSTNQMLGNMQRPNMGFQNGYNTYQQQRLYHSINNVGDAFQKRQHIGMW